MISLTKIRSIMYNINIIYNFAAIFIKYTSFLLLIFETLTSCSLCALVLTLNHGQD